MNGHISACFDEDGTRVCGFDEHPEAVGPEACSLDAAWAEAEAALPEGWKIDGMVHLLPPKDPKAGEAWIASANRVRPDGRWFGRNIEGDPRPTPAAALRSLAAKLRDAR